jgi:hypothetical protein
VEHKDLMGQMKQQSFTRFFGGYASWETCLEQVHEHNWRKWHVVKDGYPLQAGQHEQVPGQIDRAIYDQLKPHIDKLPTYQSYAKKKAELKI